MGNQSNRRGNDFFARIKTNYGYHTLSFLKKFSQINVQLRVKYNQRILLLRCRREKVLPKHLQLHARNLVLFDNNNITRTHLSAINKFKFTVLNLEIRDICITIHRLEKDFQFLQQKIKQKLPAHIYKQFFLYESNKAQKIFSAQKNICKSKFVNLIKEKNNFLTNDNAFCHDPVESWFTNLTDTQFPPAVANTLSLGKNFGIPFRHKTIPTKHIIADFESNIHKINEGDRNEARLKLVNCINTYSHQIRNPTNNFQKQIIHNSQLTKTFLKNNPNILITKADKSNTTVAIEKNKYIDDVQLMLSDKNR